MSQIKLIQQFADEMVARQVVQFVKLREVEVVDEIMQVLWCRGRCFGLWRSRGS